MNARLADAVSPYLRSHAGNPVDWYPWGDEAFAAARERDVPVLVSIGYATCHWCHVMARESFADPGLAAYLNDHFVAVKVDREEHPEVDAAYLAAAGVFTDQLGWPLNVFTTPDGRAFHAGTYSPPVPVAGHPSFRQVLEAVAEAWEQRRGEIEAMSAQLAQALTAAASRPGRAGSMTPDALGAVAEELTGYEDREFGGFGGAPKFPAAPVLLLALALARSTIVPGDAAGPIGDVARRALAAMRDRGLRDPVEGGFFRYAVRREWTEPHYERMLTDNALLLRAYAEAGDRATATGVAAFLRDVLQRPDGTFASAQDSESEVDGRRTEGGYYLLDAAGRCHQPPPAVDGKVLTGWNGLTIGALARAGQLLHEPDWVALAERAAETLLAAHRLPGGRLRRASLDGRPSPAAAALEDYGGLADGLLELAIAAGRPDLAVVGRELVDACLTGDRFAVPGGGDPTLAAMGLPGDADPGEGACPSGATLLASAAWRLFLLTGEHAYRAAAEATVASVAALALARPISFGGLLAVALATVEPVRQLVVVTPDPTAELAHAARGMPTAVTAVVGEETAEAFAAAGFELFAGKPTQGGRPTAYACRDFVCRLPVTEPRDLAGAFE